MFQLETTHILNFDQAVTKNILENVINSLHRCNYIVVAIVSDMGSTNIKLWNELGIDINTNTFKHPSDENKVIFVFADIPHLLKLLRNHFLDEGFTLFDKILTKDCIENFLQIADTSELRIGHKLTRNLLDVKGSQRQKVKTAAKLLSHTTAKVIKFCGDNKLINSPYYEELSQFIELTDKWFDIFNMSQKFEKGKGSYGIDLTTQNNTLDEMTHVIENLRAIKRSTLLPFQKGILISNKSLKGLYEYLNEHYDLEYILTRRLNQDILENFFSYIRAMGGTNENPNPIDFKHRLKWYILGKHSPSDLGQNKNCEADDVAKLTAPLEEQEVCLTAPLFMSIINTAPEKKFYTEEADSTDLFTNLQFVSDEFDPNIVLPLTIINNEGQKYLAGYAAHRYRSKYPHLGTPTDKNHELPSSSNMDWIQFLSEGRLMQPSSDLLYATQVMETLFHSFHGSEIKKVPNVIKILVGMIEEQIKDSACVPHEVLSCLVRTRKYIRIRELNKLSFQQTLRGKSAKKMKKILGK
jgi:hypothetical protein